MQAKLNQMHRQCNKQVYEIEAKINDIYYGKELNLESSLDNEADNSTQHSFGYGQPTQRRGGAKAHPDEMEGNTDAQQVWMQSKIDQIKDSILEIQQFFDQNRDELIEGDGQKQKDNQVYWKKKIEQLNKKTNMMPNQMIRAFKNSQKIKGEQEKLQKAKASALDKKKIKTMTDENDSLGRSTSYAAEIESNGGSILKSLNGQQEQLRGVKSKTQEMLNSIGMSDNIMTLIERRSKTDLLIFFGLAIGLILFMYWMIMYVKPNMKYMDYSKVDDEGQCAVDVNNPGVKTEC